MRTIDAAGQLAEPGSPDTPGSPATRQLVDAVVEELHGMIGSLRCAGTGRMVKAGISMTHLHILWVLEHHGDLPMSRLADLLDVSLSPAAPTPPPRQPPPASSSTPSSRSSTG